MFGTEDSAVGSVGADGFGVEASGEILLDFAFRALRRGSVAISFFWQFLRGLCVLVALMSYMPTLKQS